MSDNLYDHLSKVASDCSKSDCLVLDSGQVISYEELFELADRVSVVLADLGVEVEDRVLAHCEKTPLTVALYLSCLKIGAIYVPLNTSYTDKELTYFIQDTEPKVYVGKTQVPMLENTSVQQLTMDEDGRGSLADAVGSAEAREVTMVPRGREHIAAILYTSGTTGLSKGAMLTQGNLLSNAQTLVDFWRFTATDSLLHALPIYHVHGLFVAIHCALLSGCRMIFQSRFDIDQVVNALADSTVLMGVPTYYTRLLTHQGFDQTKVANMRLFISGSAPLAEHTFKEFYRRTGMTILERYGMSETLMNTSNPLEGERIAGTVGFALPGIDIKITNTEGKTLPSGEVGGIELKGPNVFSGYWRKPEITQREFKPDGYFITGDMGIKDEEGRISIVGREKDLVISGGLNVYPAEVESTIGDMAEIQDVAIIGAPHPDFGEGVVAVLVASRELSVKEVREYLSDKLAGYKRPQAVVYLDELPHNAMGKVQKKELREQFQDVFQ